jgi:hypothetical protein
MSASFADRVRIRECPDTIAASVALLEGEVYGFTTPSVTGVEVVGGAPDDYAINVSLEPSGACLWFRPDLVEFIDHNAGAEVVVGNVKAVRQTDGTWLESPVSPQSKPDRPKSKAWAWLRRYFTGR